MRWRTAFHIFVTLSLSLGKPLFAEVPTFSPKTTGPHKGWDYLALRLRQNGIPEKMLQDVYGDKRMPPFSEIPFAAAPKETLRQYKEFTDPKRIQIAKAQLKKHRKHFSEAEEKFSVERTVIAAILLVETHFGENTGKSSVLNQLSRVASVGDPRNLIWNTKRLQEEDQTLKEEEVRARARYLESVFLPEVQALMKIHGRRMLDIYSLKGSIAGAFGYCQFLPSSYLRFGVDGDEDGDIDLFSFADAIHSAAHYLHKHGWKDSLNEESKLKVLWHYNRSAPYGMTILKVAGLL